MASPLIAPVAGIFDLHMEASNSSKIQVKFLYYLPDFIFSSSV